MGKRICFLFSCVLGLACLVFGADAQAKSYFVATDGNDNNSGDTEAPWKTINRAMRAALQPGDEVVVRAGVYRESVFVSRSGSSSAYITLRSEVTGGATIYPPADNGNMGIQIAANYISVVGFTVYKSDKSGIGGRRVHHVRVARNTSHHNRTAGIFFMESDFLNITSNTVYGNANYAVTSGISILEPLNITNDPHNTGYRIVIRNNIVFNNIMKTGGHTDGHGIIMDRFRETLNGQPPYTFLSLIEGNLTYFNGGSGINLYNSDYVMVRNNTAFSNNIDLEGPAGWRGEIQNSLSSHNTFINNIAYANPKIHPANKAFENASTKEFKTKNIVYKNNLAFNGTVGNPSVSANWGGARPTASDGNLLGVNPMFVSILNRNFELRPASPAINRGTNVYGAEPYDRSGGLRKIGVIDIGAFEFGN